MKNITPLFPGFHLQILRKTTRTAIQIMADKLAEIKQKTFWQLGVCFGDYIPSHYLAQSGYCTNSRRRLLSKENTFWSFLSQVLDADWCCKEVVRKLQVFFRHEVDEESIGSDSLLITYTVNCHG